MGLGVRRPPRNQSIVSHGVRERSRDVGPAQPVRFPGWLLTSSWVVACVLHHHFSQFSFATVLWSGLAIPLFVTFPWQ